VKGVVVWWFINKTEGIRKKRIGRNLHDCRHDFVRSCPFPPFSLFLTIVGRCVFCGVGHDADVSESLRVKGIAGGKLKIAMKIKKMKKMKMEKAKRLRSTRGTHTQRDEVT
jgi:hypothetical protein